MNIQELLGFVEQIVEPNVSKILAKSYATLHSDLMAEDFTREEAVRIVIAMAGKSKNGGS